MAPIIDCLSEILPDTSASISLPIPALIGIGGLFAIGVVARRCTPALCTAEELDHKLFSLDQLINENNSYREDLLGEAGSAFKHSLREIYSRVEALKQARREHDMSPQTSRIFRGLFSCREQYELRSCKALLRNVETEINDHIQASKTSRAYELTEARRSTGRFSH